MRTNQRAPRPPLPLIGAICPRTHACARVCTNAIWRDHAIALKWFNCASTIVNYNWVFSRRENTTIVSHKGVRCLLTRANFNGLYRRGSGKAFPPFSKANSQRTHMLMLKSDHADTLKAFYLSRTSSIHIVISSSILFS